MVMILTNLLINRESETPFEGEENMPMFLLACNVLKRITRFVRVCPVFYPLKRQVIFRSLLYKETPFCTIVPSFNVHVLSQKYT